LPLEQFYSSAALAADFAPTACAAASELAITLRKNFAFFSFAFEGEEEVVTIAAVSSGQAVPAHDAAAVLLSPLPCLAVVQLPPPFCSPTKQQSAFLSAKKSARQKSAKHDALWAGNYPMQCRKEKRRRCE